MSWTTLLMAFAATTAAAATWLVRDVLVQGAPSYGAMAALIIAGGTLLGWLVAGKKEPHAAPWCLECHAGIGAYRHGFCGQCGRIAA